MLRPNHFVLSRLLGRWLGFVSLQEHSLPLATSTGALIAETMKGYQSHMSVIPCQNKPLDAGAVVDVQFYLLRYHSLLFR